MALASVHAIGFSANKLVSAWPYCVTNQERYFYSDSASPSFCGFRRESSVVKLWSSTKRRYIPAYPRGNDGA
jgi:hypothetical protein